MTQRKHTIEKELKQAEEAKQNKVFNHRMTKNPHKPMETSPTKHTTGTGLTKQSKLTQLFGCHKCPWYSTPACPHEIGRKRYSKDSLYHKKNEVVKSHTNGVCSYRINHIQEFLPKPINIIPYSQLAQYSVLVNSTDVADDLLRKAKKTGEGYDDALPWFKLIVDLTSKMRKQDEGIRVEHSNPLDRMRSVIIDVDHKEADVKEIEDKENENN